MSKTIRKIPWAVPGLATFAVVAALIAFGVLGANTAQALGDDECGFANTAAAPDTFAEVPPAADGDCLVLADSVEIMVENTSSTDELAVAVLASGGSQYPKVVVTNGKTGVDQHNFVLDALVSTFGTDMPGLGSFTVTRDMAKDGVVVLSVYDTFTNFPLDADSDALPLTADATLNVVFLGAPALKAADDSPLSTLVRDPTGGVIASDTASVTTTATIKDANNNLLVDGNDDVDSYVTFTVTYAEGSDLKLRTQLVSTAEVPVDDVGEAELVISDWNTDALPANVGPVKVTVGAIYTGPTGTLDLGDAVYQRADPTPTALEVATFSCRTDPGNTEADDGCADGSEPVADMVFGREEVFVIVGEFTDVLGSTVPVASPSVVASSTAALTVDTTAGNIVDGEIATVTVDDEAEFGDYTITVSTGAGDDLVEQVLAITVSGPPVSYSLVDPAATIALGAGSSQEFTVSARDVNGSVPFFGDDNTVEVIIRGAGPNDVFGLEAGNLLTLDADTGEGTFEIFTPLGAEDGDEAQILVRTGGEVKARHTVTFGEAVAPMPMLTAPTDVTATADAGTVTVTWTDGADALGHLVLLFNADFSSAPMVNAVPTGSSSAQFMDVAAGDYVAVVVSYRSASETAYAVGTVTVNANGVDGVGTAAAN